MFTLSRKIDINYPTNRLILIIFGLVSIIGGIISKNIVSGLYFGAGSFLTWALTREADPKQEYSAFVSVLISLINLIYFQNIQLFIMFWIMLMMRLINGITGKSLTSFDVFSVFGLTTYLTFTSKNSVYLLIFILAMMLLIKLKQQIKTSLIAGSIGVVIINYFSLNTGYLALKFIENSSQLNILVLSLLLLSFIYYRLSFKEIIIDDSGNSIDNNKILFSQIFFNILIVLLFFFTKVTLNNLIIYLSVVIGPVIYFIIKKFTAKLPRF